ncbi:glycosyltransferase family protein [Vibrio bathopelagicus]|uniref:hypothetical protein n=1 Tax=Vibrio bathopelagicus TaxID=2777577 RepID=UPI0018650D80|nr:hypothetical protein [Vibrio bathopelagicus]
MDGYICKSNKTERVVAISDALKNDMSDLMNIDKNKILVAHDGADLVDIENVCDVELLGSSNFNLGYVGSLLEGKGVDLICEAAKSLPNMGFHIVGGEGELLHEYKHKYEHIPNLYFYGYVQQKWFRVI